MTWQFSNPGKGRWSLWVRHARQARKGLAEPAVFTVQLQSQKRGRIESPSTGGWGAAEKEWGWSRLPIGELEGPLRKLVLSWSRRGLKNDTHLDVFLIAPEETVKLPALAPWHEHGDYSTQPWRRLLATARLLDRSPAEGEARSLARFAEAAKRACKRGAVHVLAVIDADLDARSVSAADHWRLLEGARKQASEWRRRLATWQDPRDLPLELETSPSRASSFIAPSLRKVVAPGSTRRRSAPRGLLAGLLGRCRRPDERFWQEIWTCGGGSPTPGYDLAWRSRDRPKEDRIRPVSCSARDAVSINAMSRETLSREASS